MINVDTYDDFVAAVHDGRRPFAWQRALAARVLEGSGWPRVLDVPTGLGKTSVLDIAVLAAAQAAQRQEQPPRRVFFVVDRRLVVDEAHEHALQLQRQLRQSEAPVLAEVATALRQLAPLDNDPDVVDVTRMRGGTTWDWRWVRRPDRLSIVTGTVDQVGSRLLFRGYGVADRRRPIDAAMVGTDGLLLVDEAHLAEPLLTTATAAQLLDSPSAPVRPVTTVVRLSATPRSAVVAEPEQVFDLQTDLQHHVARQRLLARKRLHTVTCPQKHLAAVLAEAGRQALRQADDSLVAVVVNTVATARDVFQRLAPEVPVDDAVLLTGRTRPLDRERVLERHLPRLTMGWRDAGVTGTRLLVATQTVEVGANLDLDVLITESAAWDALVQRLGRLNRSGQSAHGRAVVVHPSGPDTPAVYGEATTRTWTWLRGLLPERSWATARAAATAWAGLDDEGLDVSPAALRELLAEHDVRALTSQPAEVPVLVRQHLDSWVRTGPVPDPDVPVHLFLHGFDSSPEPVRVVWRADVDEGHLAGGRWEDVTALLRALPPRQEEVLEVPVAAVRAWLRGTALAVADTEMAGEPANGQRYAGVERPAVALRPMADGLDVSLVTPQQITPGQLLVVPATYGGCDRFGWDPASRVPVLDLADLAVPGRGAAPVLRLTQKTLTPTIEAVAPQVAAEVHARLAELSAALQEDPEGGLPGDMPSADAEPGREVEAVPAALARLAHVLGQLSGSGEESPDPWTARWTQLWKSVGGGRLVPEPSLRLVTDKRRNDVLSDDESHDGSSAVGSRQTLADHSDEVAAYAGAVATGLGLPEALIRTVELAARWHDLGKVEPRFQALLHGGDSTRVDPARPLAKSGMAAADWVARREARRASGWPRGGRHEELSSVLVQARLDAGVDVPEGVDRDLVLHLVASHHGHARPLLPPVRDAQRLQTLRDELAGAVAVPRLSVDWLHVDRFALLNRRYGRWGLALLESVVRLSDMASSAGEIVPRGTP